MFASENPKQYDAVVSLGQAGAIWEKFTYV